MLLLPPASHSLSPAASRVLGGAAVEDIDSAATISSAFACARMQHGYVTGNNGSSIEREGEKRARGYRGGDALVNFQPFHHVCACLYVCVFGGYSWMTEMGEANNNKKEWKKKYIKTGGKEPVECAGQSTTCSQNVE